MEQVAAGPAVRKQTTNTWTTTDIVLVAVIGVAFGVIETGFSTIYQLGIAAFGPIWTSIFIPFQIGKCLTVFIIRKPGVAFVSGLIGGLTQFLSGNPAGALTLAWGFTQGLGAEIPFLATRYRNYGIVNFCLAAGLASIMAKAVSVVAFGWAALGWKFLTFLWILGFITGGLQNGLIAYGIGKLLQKSGLIRSFRGGAV